MQIFITSHSNRTRLAEVEPNTTILEIKDKIYDWENIPQHMQNLMYNGKYISDDKCLSDYNILSDSTIRCFLKLNFNKDCNLCENNNLVNETYDSNMNEIYDELLQIALYMSLVSRTISNHSNQNVKDTSNENAQFTNFI